MLPAALKMSMAPLAPSLATTAFESVWPGAKLMLDASGRASPEGYTVSQPPAVGSVTATFSTTDDTPVAGISTRGDSVSDRVSPGARAPPSSLVSKTRYGATGWKAPSVETGRPKTRMPPSFPTYR